MCLVRDFKTNAITLVASCSKAGPQWLNFKLSALQVKALHFSFYKNNSAWKAYSTRWRKMPASMGILCMFYKVFMKYGFSWRKFLPVPITLMLVWCYGSNHFDARLEGLALNFQDNFGSYEFCDPFSHFGYILHNVGPLGETKLISTS